MPRKRKPDSPFRSCTASPGVIRLVVMMDVKYAPIGVELRLDMTASAGLRFSG